jgi:hypothetical protein
MSRDIIAINIEKDDELTPPASPTPDASEKPRRFRTN